MTSKALGVLRAALRLIVAGLQVFTIYLAVYKHFMEAIDAIDNGETQAYTRSREGRRNCLSQYSAASCTGDGNMSLP